jgi:hypothetical protein
MITYDVDILEVQTGEVRTTPMWVGWTRCSPQVYRQSMCDCNLYGYRERGYATEAGGGGWQWEGQAHESVAYNFIQRHGCDHSMPPKYYRALVAYLNDGRVFDFTLGRFVGEPDG